MLSSGRAGPIFKIPVEQRPDSIDAAFDSQRFVLVWSTSKAGLDAASVAEDAVVR